MAAAKRDPEATRAAILDAAEEVFLDRGFGNASTAEIARRGGVTKSLIHHHFGSKDNLWGEVKERRFREYSEAQMRLLESSAPDAELLRTSMSVYFRFLEKNPEVSRILAWTYAERTEEGVEEYGRLVQAGIGVIREAQEQGELRDDVEPALILFSFVALAQHWFLAREHFFGKVMPERSVDELDAMALPALVKIYFEGVLPRAAADDRTAAEDAPPTDSPED